MIKLARAMQYLINTELSSREETRFEFNREHWSDQAWD